VDFPDLDPFTDDTITVTRQEGERTASGFEETGTKTVLDVEGDAQQGTRAYEQRAAFYETGDLLFFAEQAVTDVQPGDSVTVETEDNRSVDGTVAEVIHDDDSLLITLDG
jgi:hypothetical protein